MTKFIRPDHEYTKTAKVAWELAKISLDSQELK